MPFSQNFSIEQNRQLREPQRVGWLKIRDHFAQADSIREVAIVLPVGCGKSGLITLCPFAVNAQRVLVVSPSTKIRNQLGDDFRGSSETNFYDRFGVLARGDEFPEVVMVESGKVNLDDIKNCDVAVANIHQVAGPDGWLQSVPQDFFDLILVDEAHHNIADSWQQVKQRLPQARVINFSGTPTRADGQLMEGLIIYSFPVVEAIRAGYVKRLRARMLSPTQLSYVHRNNDGEVRVIGPDEVRALGETDSEFRRGIVQSDESLASIVDQSIDELRKLRVETGENRLKIIASALNRDHCIQITEAFNARHLRADYVHSLDTKTNGRVFQRLENHDLDVIVQARMLTEGFDHKYLAVAMVGSVFAHLSPFVQFVGRIMRAIEQNQPGHVLNQGRVVFHLGSNIASRWDDFRSFSEADQEFFAELLPGIEEIQFTGESVEREPSLGSSIPPIEILSETGVRTSEMEPIGDQQKAALFGRLADLGVTEDQAFEEIKRLRVSRQDLRVARRASLHDRIQTSAGAVLGILKINHRGRTLDRSRRRENFAWTVSELNKRVNEAVAGKNADRENFTLDQLEKGHEILSDIAQQLEEEIRNGA